MMILALLALALSAHGGGSNPAVSEAPVAPALGQQEEGAMMAAWQSGHYGEALKFARSLAVGGDAKAEALLARAYYDGMGAPRDDRYAFHWAQLAAKANDGDGLYYLGRCYENGRWVPRDPTKASDLYHRAIEQGQLEARSARSY